MGVDIRGNHEIFTATIRSNLKTKIGDRVNMTVIQGDIRSLYSLGFADVQVEEEKTYNAGDTIVFKVKEKNSNSTRP